VLRNVLQIRKVDDMESATIREVQHNLAAYVRRVEHGEEIEIRRRSKVVARLVPAANGKTAERDLNWEAVSERRNRLWGGKPAPGKPASEIVYESRRRPAPALWT
jgi:prevent-host-death family protein